MSAHDKQIVWNYSIKRKNIVVKDTLYELEMENKP